MNRRLTLFFQILGGLFAVTALVIVPIYGDAIAASGLGRYYAPLVGMVLIVTGGLLVAFSGPFRDEIERQNATYAKVPVLNRLLRPMPTFNRLMAILVGGAFFAIGCYVVVRTVLGTGES